LDYSVLQGFCLCLRPLARWVASNFAGGPAFFLGRLGGRVVGHRDRQGAAGHIIPFGHDRNSIVAMRAVEQTRFVQVSGAPTDMASHVDQCVRLPSQLCASN
jgi:hypothetical protein